MDGRRAGGRLSRAAAILHVGSISSWTAPGSDAIARLVDRVAGSALISVDPNIRPPLAEGPVGASLGNTAPVVRERIDRLVRRADIVKVSAEDLEWLEPDVHGDRRAGRRRAALGGARPGPASCSPTAAARCGSPGPGRPVVHREPVRVTVADTVGRG